MRPMKCFSLCIAIAAGVQAQQSTPHRDHQPFEVIQSEVERLRSEGWIVIRTVGWQQKRTMIFAVTRDQILRVPEWFGAGNPPLDIATASVIAIDYVVAKNPDSDRLFLRSFSAERVRGNILDTDYRSYANRWYYIINLMTRKEHEDPKVRGFSLYAIPPVYVLMDGTIVEPKNILER